MNLFLTLEKLFQKTLFDLKKVLKFVVGLGYAFESVYFAVFRLVPILPNVVPISPPSSANLTFENKKIWGMNSFLTFKILFQ